MFGFVGYIVHSLNLRWTFDQIAQAVPKDLSAPAVWDAIPEVAKWQIILFAGLMEVCHPATRNPFPFVAPCVAVPALCSVQIWRENKMVLEGEGQKHYMSGGKPGYFPSFAMIPHPTPFKLFDPFGLSRDASEEKKVCGALSALLPPHTSASSLYCIALPSCPLVYLLTCARRPFLTGQGSPRRDQ
jgi:hypothetical protein